MIKERIIPDGWKEVRLNDVCEKIQDGNYGGSYPKENEFISSGIPFLTSKAVGASGKVIESKIDFISQEKHNTLKKAVIKNHDILFTNRGAKVGAVAYYNFPEYKEGNIGPQVTLMRVNNKITTQYLFQYMKSSLFTGQVKRKDNGSAMGFFSLTETQKFIITVPETLEEQKRIAEILTGYDDVIELTTSKISQLKLQKKSLMQKLLSPKPHWTEKRISDCVNNFTTGKLDANAMVKNGKYRFYTCAKEIFSINDYAFDDEALLVSGNGANLGYIHYYKGKFNAYQRTYVLTGFDCNVFYLKFFLDSFLPKRIWQEKSDGNTPYIKINCLTDMKFSFPPLPEQEEIAEVLKAQDDVISLNENKLENLKQQKKALMQKLLTGEWRV